MLSRGRLLQVGTPEDLYHAPTTREVAEFVGRAALLPAERMGEGVWVTVGSVALAAPARAPANAAAARTARAASPCCDRSRSRSWTTTSSRRGRDASPAGGSPAGTPSIDVRLESGAIVEVMGNGFGAPEGETVARAARRGQPLAVVPA